MINLVARVNYEFYAIIDDEFACVPLPGDTLMVRGVDVVVQSRKLFGKSARLVVSGLSYENAVATGWTIHRAEEYRL